MDIFGILTMIGGLALFLYGMNTMGQGLEKLSGSRLERILEKLTSNPIKSVALGALVTAVIQSSSAATVMVVGFVNSGIMKLSQAVGVIIGANVGTTITSWLLSLTGIGGDNIFIQLLKPMSFTPILAIIGIFMIMMSKSSRKKDIGGILVGFTVLMVGMDMMSGAVEPLAENEEFRNILIMFSNPLLGVLAGMVLTAIIQSSSASIGILQAVCATGAVTYGTAIPVIMGQNIGTCITAMLSCMGANKNAKRAALVHLYFNLIGTALFMILFYTVQAVHPLAFVDEHAGYVGIAVVHTVFNLFAAAVLLPFAKGLEKLACLTIRDKEEDGDEPQKDEFQILDPRFLATPSVALEQCKQVAARMAECARDTLKLSISLLGDFNERDTARVVDNEETVDNYEDKLGSYLLNLGSSNMTVAESQTINMLLHCIGDFERIADHAVNIRDCAVEMHDKELEFSKKARNEIRIFSDAVKEILDTAVTAFENNDIEIAKSIEPLEEVIDRLSSDIRDRHIKRLRKGKCTIELGFVLADLVTNFERVADHCSNIAVCIIQIKENSFDTHNYLNVLKAEENKEFDEKFAKYTEKYMLP
ncbi:MAG: Na/Pi cotransporter family protein [Eubacterium sp.]|nr:Na/Pi cotransporter family protein [Eubacterium sp.]